MSRIEEINAVRQADKARFEQQNLDVCQRCGRKGNDRRSLFVDCLWDIKEMIPEFIDLHLVAGPCAKRGHYMRSPRARRRSEMSRYMITASRQYYAGTLNVDRREHHVPMPVRNAPQQCWDDVWIFATRGAAAAAIAEQDRHTYVCSHGEYARPVYRIRRADSRNGRAILAREV